MLKVDPHACSITTLAYLQRRQLAELLSFSLIAALVAVREYNALHDVTCSRAIHSMGCVFMGAPPAAREVFLPCQRMSRVHMLGCQIVLQLDHMFGLNRSAPALSRSGALLQRDECSPCATWTAAVSHAHLDVPDTAPEQARIRVVGYADGDQIDDQTALRCLSVDVKNQGQVGELCKDVLDDCRADQGCKLRIENQERLEHAWHRSA